MKKLLIITYYWPPAGGAGVFRWLKFSKYLREYGWEPVIYTSEGGEYSVVDNSLLKDVPENITVLKQPVWEPYNVYKKFTGRKKEDKINVGFLSVNKKKKFTEKAAVWIRGNFFIPDARVFWIKPSAKYLITYLKENPVDAMVSTGPPHSAHLIALRIKKQLGIPWLADFRDPWTYIDFYQELMLTGFADRKHHRLEQEVLKNADKIITVSWDWARDFEKSGAKNVAVITNGFDEDDLAKDDINPDKKFSITHIGSLVKSRNPYTLWKALKELIVSNPGLKNDLEIKLVGKVDYSVIESIKENHLESSATLVEHVPHNEVMRVIQQSQVLMLLINNTPNAMGIIPGKFFEYLSTRRPILCIGLPDSDIARILRESNAGKTIDFEDTGGLKSYILELYALYKSGNLNSVSNDINKYSRRALAGTVASLLNTVVK
ncbi:MAG: glycosyltransferase family 4 protein [Bacteroidia bacterium]|nr:glycosyltransferase family 4 protein [Bacteroidia bacterium]